MFGRPGLFILLLCFLASCNGSSEFGQEPPEGRSGSEADSLAERMLEAIHYEAWDSTRYVRWSFSGHRFLWDKERDFVRVEWSDRKVLLKLNSIEGEAYENGDTLSGEEKEEAVQKAWEYFCNDSFWLNAPAKAFDKGTVRKLVETEDGDKQLLVTYESGGVTPGDSYLWKLDTNGLPQSYRMWVSIIPIGGIKASWDEWRTLSTGARIATLHEMSIANLRIKNLKGGQDLESFDIEEDPFAPLQK